MAFLAAMYTLTSEIKRREREGRLVGRLEKEWTGKPLEISEYIISGLIGFAIGYKLVDIFSSAEVGVS